MRIFIVILMLIVMIMLRVVVIFMAMLISQVQTRFKGKDKKAYDRLDNKYRKQVNRSCRSHPLFFLSDSIRIVCVKRV